MAQTGYSVLSLYYSSTASNVPTAGNLVAGELAINTADGKLFYKDSSGVVQVIGTKGGVGSSTTTQVLYNSNGLVVGSANMTFNGTTLTTANDASISGLTVGKGGGSQSTSTTLGNQAGAGTQTVGYNTAIGYQAGKAITSGTDNIAVGQALVTTTTGSANIAIGDGALYSNTTASNNTSVGGGAMFANTTGASNSAFGYQTLASNTTASNNTAVGYQAGYSGTTGADNVHLGYKAGYSRTTGAGNCIIGDSAGYSLTTGNANTFVGAGQYSNNGCGYYVTTGTNNTILGAYDGNTGGLDIRTANGYIVLSDGAGNPRGIFDSSGNFFVGCTSVPNLGITGQYGFSVSSAEVVISKNTNNPALYIRNVGGTTATAIIFYNGNTSIGSITTTTSATAYNTSSDYRLKENIAPMQNALNVVQQLKPVTYKWKVDGSDGQGFIAHELQEVMPDCVTGTKDAVDEEGNPVYQGIDTSFLVATLTAAIQELKAEVDSLKQQLGK